MELKAVLLVGGAGTRMRPLTYVIPKCLLPLGGQPLIQRTIRYLEGYGIKEFVLCVAYLKKQVIDAIGDGKELGVSVVYAEADSPLGTAGQLKTAQPYLGETFLAMNGDIITDLNIGHLIKSHHEGNGIATIAVKKYGVKIPYGHITVDQDSRIVAFAEKPTISYLANAGVYVMEPKILSYIPGGRQSSLETEIFPSLLSKGERINSYFEEADWADVGSMADFERVNDQVLANGA
jgi:NDP-sugar pyrophosphorylase family protein